VRSVLLSLLGLLCLPAGARAASYAGKPTRQGGLTLSAAVAGQRVALDLSRLRWGRAPEAGGTDDRVLADGRGGTVELRIPWALLTYADPSSHAIAVPRPDGSVATAHAGPVGIAVAPAGRPAAAARAYRFAGWNRVRWHERRKAGWRTVARAMAAASR
jgi:hypothetical protein